MSEDVSLDVVRDKMKRVILGDSPDGFSLFFAAVFNRPLMRHGLGWVRGIYDAHADGMGAIVESFRFSWKTTVITNAFLAYRIGLEPHKTNIIVQVKDDTAEETAMKVAEIIESNPVWKWVFPHVVPDKKRGWANKGYYVKRTDMEYGEWIRLTGRDPTFVGYGYTSDSIIGKHPSGLLVIDDIHNHENTTSARELQNCLSILTSTILPTIDPVSTWSIVVGTPWVAKDTIGHLKTTGRFMAMKTIIMTDESGGRNGEPTWPEMYDEEEIEKLKSMSGPIEFRRMYMCDISGTEGIRLKREWLHEYENEKINPTWQVVFGVDYASTSIVGKSARVDYFALAVGVVVPGGGVVLVDGVYEHLSQAEAQQRIKAMAALYPTLHSIGVETQGKGAELFNLLVYSSNLPLVPMTGGNKSKQYKFEQSLAPAFQIGRMRISDKPTSFLTAFRNEWLSFPFGEHDDALDAVYYMALAGASELMDFNPPPPGQILGRREKKPSPWLVFGGTDVSRGPVRDGEGRPPDDHHSSKVRMGL